jgi:glycosyltransferase involved in cell wall biosynthesis
MECHAWAWQIQSCMEFWDMPLSIRHLLPGAVALPTELGASAMRGLLNVALSLALHQAEAGHRVEIVGGSASGKPACYPLKAVQACSLALWTWARAGRWNLTWVAPIWWFCARHRPVDVLHVHLDPNLLLAPRAQVRVLHIHNDVGSPLPPAYLRLLSRADQVFCVSDFVRQRFLRASRLPADRVSVLYNGATPPPPVSTSAARALRADWGVAESATVLLFAGAVIPDKGLIHLVEAFNQARSAWPSLELVVAASPTISPHRAAYEATVRDCAQGLPVRFVGSIPQDSMGAAYRASDLVLIPSIVQEGFPLVACEAMAAGRPVIASSTGGIPEVVIRGGTGLLVPAGDADALARAILRLASDHDLRYELGRAALERARAFTWDAAAERAEEMYRRLLNSKLHDRRRSAGQ